VARWYRNKVIKQGVTQLARTLEHLQSGDPLELSNERGVTVDLAQCQATAIHKLIVYFPSPLLAPTLVRKKSSISKRIGFVHLMEAADYINVCTTLVTPFEIAEYLAWRQTLCLKKPDACDAVFEKSLVGQYVVGEDDVEPGGHYDEYADRLSTDVNEHNIYGILHKFLSRIQFGNTGKQYYLILKELAKLTRGMMGDFLDRFKWGMKESRKESPGLPSRIAILKYDCSFIFIPISAKEADRSIAAVESFTHLSKYDFKTRKAIGLTISPAPDSDKEYLVNWCYLDSNWQYDELTENFLRENNPFRPTKGVRVPKYTFN